MTTIDVFYSILRIKKVFIRKELQTQGSDYLHYYSVQF